MCTTRKYLLSGLKLHSYLPFVNTLALEEGGSGQEEMVSTFRNQVLKH